MGQLVMIILTKKKKPSRALNRVKGQLLFFLGGIHSQLEITIYKIDRYISDAFHSENEAEKLTSDEIRTLRRIQYSLEHVMKITGRCKDIYQRSSLVNKSKK